MSSGTAHPARRRQACTVRDDVDAAYAQFKERIDEINDLERRGALLRWDQQVNMPPRGGEVRAEQLGTLGRLSHDALVSDELGRLLEELAPYEESQPYDSDEASLIRTVRREWEKERRVPAELPAEILRSNSLALPLWAEARQKSDFSIFLPALRATSSCAGATSSASTASTATTSRTTCCSTTSSRA